MSTELPVAAEPEAPLATARTLRDEDRLEEAADAYVAVLEAEPANAGACRELGEVCQRLGRHLLAIKAFERALSMRGDDVQACHLLGNSLRALGRFEQALAAFERALALDPRHVPALESHAFTRYWTGDVDAALAGYRRVIEVDPDNPGAHMSLGIMYLTRGDFANGWREYEWRRRVPGEGDSPSDRPEWRGEPLAGRTLLMLAEQGLGDTIQMLRYAGELERRHGARVLVHCPSRLARLARGAHGVADVVVEGLPLPPHDFQVPCMSVPAVLGEREETIPAPVPYLTVDPDRRRRWADELERLAPRSRAGPRIGLVWQGRPGHPLDPLRSLPLAAFAPLATLDGATLISLQVGAGVEQIETVRGRLDIGDPGPRFEASADGFLDSAAVLSELDLLITVDTAIAHLAGALGIATWVVLGPVPDWRWMLARRDSPWYPSVRLFRQSARGGPAGQAALMAEVAAGIRRAFPAVGVRPPAAHRLASSPASRVVRARHGLLAYNPNDVYVGRSIECYGEYSEAEIDLLGQLVRSGDVVVEAGANVGTHTLALSRLVGPEGRVHAFEPQPRIFELLCANLALNGVDNVEAHRHALGAGPGETPMPLLDSRVASNFGAAALGDGPGITAVSTIDALALAACRLIKADVEGMEREVLLGARETIARHRPVLYLENDRPDRCAALIEHVLALGYRAYWHTPGLYRAANFFGNDENVFGGIRSVNMLCVPDRMRSSVSGLRPIDSPHSDWRSST